MAESKKVNEKNEENRGALFIPAGILTGIGVGFALNNVAAGTMIGLGVGFTLFAVISVATKK